ncbi:MAG: helix-turn-helix domain-containing protein [Anaeromicrobium sp.]|uniref:helix-turn-helix transcriptional regulator n=1 Tax=Anaeromicrobium sp. TaxID=1929132 RepID=UPI0025F11E88|nr:helix-turn-helix domain-containing protein [Anaeromicrobium sp.]MCT4595889.1 helix-turn-helix domain-containing protein [Anaeromicrobium sp.]
MTREDFIKITDGKVKLIRNEFNYTQDKMAQILGISKKTLIQVEKGRSSLGWTTSVALCTLFKDSEIIQMVFGGSVEGLLLTLAFDNYDANYPKTLGGKLWWKHIEDKSGHKIQQNIISSHYRILDEQDRRISSSFDLEYIKDQFEKLTS